MVDLWTAVGYARSLEDLAVLVQAGPVILCDMVPGTGVGPPDPVEDEVPPERFNVFTPGRRLPASSVQQERQRSRSRTPLPKKRTRPKVAPAVQVQSGTAGRP